MAVASLAAVAVAVEEQPYVVLDAEFRIVEASWAVDEGVVARGRSPLEYFPGARPVFFPYLQEAKRTGRAVEFAQYFDGDVFDVKVVPVGTTLRVTWERLCTLDVLTIDGLRASLQQMLDTLRARERGLRLQGARDALRVVEGGV
jgi:hypothetical protein